MKKLLCIAVSSIALAGISVTAVAADTGFYIGASAGETEIDYRSVAGAVVTDDEDTSWKLFAGYNLNRNFAVEAAYRDLGESSVTILGTPASIDADAYSLSVIGKLPLGDRFDLMAKLGYAGVDAEVSFSGIVVGADESDVLYGLGANYRLTESIDLRAEWELIDTDDEINSLSVGVGYRF